MPSVPDHLVAARVEGGQEVESRDAAGRAVAGPVAIERNHDCGTVMSLHDPGRDDPDYALVPAFAGQHEHRAVPEPPRLGLGLPGDPLLDRPALGVQLVELGGD